MLAAALRWRRRIFIALPFVILWILSTPVLADMLMRSLEDRYPYRSSSNCPVADAVFVLGGGILGPGDQSGADVDWGPSAVRFDRALNLFTSGRARVLLISAGGPAVFGEGARLREIAIQRGIPAQSVLVTRAVLNTAAEADALAELADRFEWKRVLLVTSAFHMPRAMRLFRSCPAEIVPVPVNYLSPPSMSSGNTGLDHFLPQAEALYRSERASREYLGLAFYSIVRL